MKRTTSILTAMLFMSCLLINYETKAQCAAGETEYIIDVLTGSFAADNAWELVDNSSGLTVLSRACASYTLTGETSSDTICLTNGTSYTFNALDDFGDSWGGGTFTISDAGCGVVHSQEPDNGIGGDGSTDCIGFDLEGSHTFTAGGPYMGCTNPAAVNYSPCATIDDGSCILPAANDECADAIAIPVGTCFTGTNIGATYSASAGSPDPSCYTSGVDPLDVWFVTMVPASGNIQITAPVISGFSSYVELYAGSCSSLTNLTAAAGTPCNTIFPGGALYIATGLPAGATVYIRYWDFFSDDFGPMELCVDDPVVGCLDPCADNYDPLAVVDDGSCTGVPTGDGDDECATATALAGPGTYMHYNGAATGTDISSCSFVDSFDVWFSYPVGTGLDSLKVYTCNSSYDTHISLWDACGGTELACNDLGSPFGGFACGTTGEIESYTPLTGAALDAVEGSTIYIRVAGYAASQGCGELIIEEVLDVTACDPGTPPANFAATVAATSVTFTWDVVPGSVGCQLGAGPSGAGFPVTRNFLGSGLTSSPPIPLSIIPAGNYQAHVRCACEISPAIIATGFSNVAQFTVPTPRLGQFSSATLHPNPATQVIRLNVNSPFNEEVQIGVYSLLGTEILARQSQLFKGENAIEFNLTDFESGSYLLRMTNGSSTSTMQFEVVK